MFAKIRLRLSFSNRFAVRQGYAKNHEDGNDDAKQSEYHNC